MLFFIYTLITFFYNLAQFVSHRHHVHDNSCLRSINIHLFFCDHNNYV